MHEHAREDRAERMELIFERRDDAEVAAAAAQAPEQIGVFVLARMDEAAVRGDDIGRDQVVAGEAVHAHQPADPATQRQAGDAGRRDSAAGRREAKRLRLVIELLVGDAGFGVDAFPRRIDADRLHRREIDHHAVLTDGAAADVVAAAADGERQRRLLGERNRSDDVGGAGAANDGGGAAVDRAVVDRGESSRSPRQRRSPRCRAGRRGGRSGLLASWPHATARAGAMTPDARALSGPRVEFDASYVPIVDTAWIRHAPSRCTTSSTALEDERIRSSRSRRL